MRSAAGVAKRWPTAPTSRAANVSGQVFVAYGRKIDVISFPSVAERFESPARWTPDSVAEVLNPLFEGRTPVTEGFAMPLG